MTKLKFLNELEKRLNAFEMPEIKNWLNYYGEMIDDRIEEGQSEEEAVASLGDMDKIINDILRQTPITKLAKTKLNRKALHGWEIAMLIIGFPLWFPLLIAAIAVVISLYAVLWSVFISLCAAALTVAVSGFALLVVAIVHAASADIVAGLFMLGLGLLLCGLAMFGQLGLNYILKGCVFLSKMPFVLIKCGLFKEVA